MFLMGESGSSDQDSFVRGDVDGSGRLNVTDVLMILRSLWGAREAPDCVDAADANDNGELTSADAVFLLNYLFVRGEAPAQPFPECGVDTLEDELGCASYERCR
jgi:hypothetical protein